MDRLTVMQQFVRVVEAGSFSGAARMLGQSQPAVSKAVGLLEAQLGVRLLVRTTRAVTVTDAGQVFYDRARVAIDAADEADAAARQSDATLSGRLRVSAPVTFARLHIVPALGAFLDQHPGIDLDLILEDRRTDLVAEGIDLALRAGQLEDSSLIATRISEGRRLLVATPAYFERHGMPASPDDLSRHRAIIYDNVRDWSFRRGDTTHTVSLAPRLYVSAAEGQREAVLAGLGLTVASHWLFASELSDGRILPTLPDWQLPGVTLSLLYPAGRRVSARARAFARFLQTIIPQAAPG